MEKIGLIAGRGNFPILFAQEARKAGYRIIAIGVKENTKRGLKNYVDKFHLIDVREFSRVVRIFKDEKVSQVAMAGQVNPYFLFNPKIMGSGEVQAFFGNIEDRRADTVFRAFIDKFEAAGLEFLNSTLFLSQYMPGEAVLSQRKPTDEEYKDIRFGFKIAKHLGSMDIGQSVCVKNGVILAIESIEGTDATLHRAARLARSAIILVKASKPTQDMRFDVPVVGLRTIKNLPMKSCLAIEAGKTLFLDQKESVALAEKKGIAIVSTFL